ncbi:efflux RND transporter permease subunit [Corallincola platygyrae]|uniref:Efflux RND transporter permease subunit n=1 Tax=Corallincola platygyrae TaxID=1193278 RepID=A0ABW4XR36_9GAMM
MHPNKSSAKNYWLNLFILRPKLGHLVMALVLVLGLMSLVVLRYEVVPKIEMGIINVTTTKAGAGPEEIELSISAPLEEEILKVNGVSKVLSRSMENLSLITVILDPDTEQAQSFKRLSDVQRAVDRAQSKLPSDLIDKPLVEALSTDNLAVAELHITGPASELVLRQQARLWEQKLRATPGVAGVERLGYRRPEISIEPDLRKLWQLGIGYSEIQQAIQLRNVRDSGGSLASLVGEKKVLTVGQFDDPLEVADVIIRSAQPGNEVRLRDVAQVVRTFEDWSVQLRSDGQLGIALLIKKQGSADELKTIASIRALLDESSPAPGVELKLVNDVSRFTYDMLDALVSNAVLGLISVFLILWLFLGGRMAFWVSVGLPFAVLATFCGMLMFGLSVNSLTLMSIILVLGMLVDDAIVTGEAIQVRKEQGLTSVDSAILGTKDIAAPVLVSVLTTILAFVPITFLGGLEGKFVAAIPLVVGMTLLASLFESKFLLPAHLAHSEFKVRPRIWLNQLQHRYQKVMRYLLRRRKLAVFGMVTVFIVVTAVSGSLVRFQLYPETAVDTIHISVELPNGTAFEQSVERVEEIEQLVRQTVPASDLLNITSQIGHHDTDPYGGSMGRNQAWAIVTVFLKPQNQVQQDQRQTLAELKQVTQSLQGFVMLRVEPMSDAPIIGKPVELEVMSDGTDKRVIAASIKQYLKRVQGVTQVWDSDRTGKAIVDLQFNHHNLASYHLSVKQVADAVRIAMDGLLISEQQLAAERIYFRLRLPPQAREKLSTLRDLFVVNELGKAVALSSVADFSLRPGEADIKRHNGRRTVTVYAEIDRSQTDVVTVNEQLSQFIAAQDWSVRYPDVTFYQGGEIEQHRASYTELGFAFAGCLMLILLVLVVLFNSFSQPLLVMAVLPFSIMGVFLTFAIQGLPLSFMALIGVLGLVGVLVNDAVVMIFTLNKEAHGGDPEKVAVLATRRFRPIVITSLTTLVGLLPTAYGLGGYNPFVAPMVMTMAWGVVFGTLISLLLLPCLFMLNDDLRVALKNIFHAHDTQQADPPINK